MEFISRPNLPNQLAQSLVQLAAHQQDPLTVGLQTIGKLADDYSESKDKERLLQKHAELQDARDQKAFERQKELKKMDMEASIYEKLLSNDRVISGMTKHLDAGAADALLVGSKSGVKTPKQTQKKAIEDDFGSSGDEQSTVTKGIPFKDLGINLPGNMLPSKEKITIDAATAKQYKLPETTIGKELTMDQVIAMRRADLAASRGRGGSGRSHPDYPKYLKIAADSLDPGTPLEVISEAADTLFADAQASQAKPGSLPKDATKKAEAEAEAKKNQKKPSIFDFFKSKPEEKKPDSEKPKRTREEILASLKKKGL